MRALVISGGGSNGAFSAGVEHTANTMYDLYVGSSSGALNCIMLAQGKHEELCNFFAIATNKMIYDKTPFNRKDKVNITKAVAGIITSKQSLSTTTKLLTLIRENYPKEAHNNTPEIVVVVSNMNTKKPEYKSSLDYSWLEFTYWVWVSTLAYPYASTVNVNGFEYADGGFTVPIPLVYACKRSNDVKAIVLSSENEVEDFKNKNIIEGLLSIIHFLMDVNLKKDIENGLHYRKHGVNIELIYLPLGEKTEPMLFTPNKQRDLIEIGKKK